jgi:hypothetical protein
VTVFTVLAVPPDPFVLLMVPLEPSSLVVVAELPWVVLPWVELPWVPLVDRVAAVAEVVPARVALPLIVVPSVVPCVGVPLEEVESSGELHASVSPPKTASTRPVSDATLQSSSQNRVRCNKAIPDG